MSPRSHSPRRAEVVFTDIAAKQVETLGPAAVFALDRAIVEISQDPTIGVALKPTSPLRQFHADEIRVIYFATVMGTVVVVAYVEA